MGMKIYNHGTILSEGQYQLQTIADIEDIVSDRKPEKDFTLLLIYLIIADSRGILCIDAYLVAVVVFLRYYGVSSLMVRVLNIIR
jgi:hypothetical protein